MADNIQRITVKAIIEKNGKVLCVQDPKGTWDMPGGKISFGEDPQTTLTRELEEELGIKQVQIAQIIHAWTFTVSKDGTDYQFVVLMYPCDIGETELTVSDEHKAMKWIARDEIESLALRQGYKDGINKYFESIT